MLSSDPATTHYTGVQTVCEWILKVNIYINKSNYSTFKILDNSIPVCQHDHYVEIQTLEQCIKPYKRLCFQLHRQEKYAWGKFIFIQQKPYFQFSTLVARLLISHLQPYPPYFSMYPDNVLKIVLTRLLLLWTSFTQKFNFTCTAVHAFVHKNENKK